MMPATDREASSLGKSRKAAAFVHWDAAVLLEPSNSSSPTAYSRSRFASQAARAPALGQVAGPDNLRIGQPFGGNGANFNGGVAVQGFQGQLCLF